MIDLIKKYATQKITLLKLEAMEKSSLASGNLVIILLLTFLFFFFWVLLNVGLGFLIANCVGSYGYGFLILAGIYFALFIIVILAKKPIKKAIANKVIQSISK